MAMGFILFNGNIVTKDRLQFDRLLWLPNDRFG